MILSTPLKANGSPEDVLDTRSKHLGEKSLHEGPQPSWFSWSGPCLLCRFCQQAQCHGLAKHAATLQMVIMSTRLTTGFKNLGKYPHEKSLVIRAWFSKMNFYITSLTNPLLEIFLKQVSGSHRRRVGTVEQIYQSRLGTYQPIDKGNFTQGHIYQSRSGTYQPIDEGNFT
jgi:hypothetical protein